MNALEKLGYKKIILNDQELLFEFGLDKGEVYMNDHCFIIINRKFNYIECFENMDGHIDEDYRDALSFEKIKAICEVI